MEDRIREIGNPPPLQLPPTLADKIRAWAETERDRSYICRDDALARGDNWEAGIWHGRKNAMVDLLANLNEGTWQPENGNETQRNTGTPTTDGDSDA